MIPDFFQNSGQQKALTKLLRLCRSRLKLSKKLVSNLIKAALSEVEAEKTMRPKESTEKAKSTLMHEAEKHPANMAGRGASSTGRTRADNGDNYTKNGFAPSETSASCRCLGI